MSRWVYIFLFTIVIIDPYEGLDYERVNAYYFNQEFSIEAAESEYQSQSQNDTNLKLSYDDYLEFKDYGHEFDTDNE